jgi:hypothetical protein
VLPDKISLFSFGDLLKEDVPPREVHFGELADDDLINDINLLGERLRIDGLGGRRCFRKEIEVSAQDEKASEEEGEDIPRPAPSSSASSTF